ncbi:MAG: histidine triad nucleotide-binding protein [Clostridia bacterium]|nr:histidine triad nucleotide-binding protein [Clostridia bacterium]
MDDCLFCKILSGEIPSKKIFENDKVYAFYDIAPQAPVHAVIIPKVHINSAECITAENSSAVAAVFEAIPEIAKLLGVSDSGYRIVNNCGENAGQTVFHMHFHLLGGEIGGKMF